MAQIQTSLRDFGATFSDDLSFLTWDIILLEDEWSTLFINWWTWSATILGWTVVFNWCLFGPKGPKAPTSLQPELLVQTRMDGSLYSHVYMFLNSPSEHNSRNRDSSDHFLLSSCEPVWTAASFSSSWLTGVRRRQSIGNCWTTLCSGVVPPPKCGRDKGNGDNF